MVKIGNVKPTKHQHVNTVNINLIHVSKVLQSSQHGFRLLLITVWTLKPTQRYKDRGTYNIKNMSQALVFCRQQMPLFYFSHLCCKNSKWLCH